MDYQRDNEDEINNDDDHPAFHTPQRSPSLSSSSPLIGQNEGQKMKPLYPDLLATSSNDTQNERKIPQGGSAAVFQEVKLDQSTAFDDLFSKFEDLSLRTNTCSISPPKPSVNISYSSSSPHHPQPHLHSQTQESSSESNIHHAEILIDANENLTVNSETDFVRQLHATSQDPSVKCVSIIGNTGDGKSYTLNQLFFNGKEKFRTSSTSDSCTMGVWSALDDNERTLILDTEGRLGLSQNDNIRNRLLLKILCISDVIIYRTRAPKLPNDMFQFLSDASNAFHKYFRGELEKVMKACQMDGPISTMGPTLIIFHETQYTEVLRDLIQSQKTPVELLKERFEKMKLSYDAYSAIEYVGTQTMGGKATDFSEMHATITEILDNNKIRSPRRLSVIFRALQALNQKFNHFIPPEMPSTLPDDFFACCAKCRCCGAKCNMSAKHQKDSIPHQSEKQCTYNVEHNNEVWKCLPCHLEGRDTIVYGKSTSKNDGIVQGLLKYAWSGCVIECPHHGEIYRSRKHWYGNSDPKDVTRIEIVHVWPGDRAVRTSSDVTPQRVVQSVRPIVDYVVSSTTTLKEMAADRFAPAYWVPNSDIHKCPVCHLEFGLQFSKHHCRKCGYIFCDTCTKWQAIVPDLHNDKMERVCQSCYERLKSQTMTPIYHSNNPHHAASDEVVAQDANDASTDASARSIPMKRRALELIRDTVGNVCYSYSIEVIKESARPSYWRPDNECEACFLCEKPFNTTTHRLHHCRKCGEGVCDQCSPGRQLVPEWDWPEPERVCKTCEKSILESKKDPK